jgi:monoamine oxidase
MSSGKTPLAAQLQRHVRSILSAQRKGIPLDEYRTSRASQAASLARASERGVGSRREFLQTFLQTLMGTTASFAVPSLLAPQRTFASNTPPLDASTRIAILGGGLAGLSAAYTLKQNGLKATVYEASGRVGGRAFTGYNLVGAGMWTELGGEFVDTAHKDMMRLTKDFEVELLDTDAPSEYKLDDVFYFDGKRRTEREFDKALEPFVGRMEAEVKQWAAGGGMDRSWSEVDALSASELLVQRGITGWIRDYIEAALCGDFGLDAGDMSALNVFALLYDSVIDDAGYDERYKIKGGVSELTKRMAEYLKGSIAYEQRLVRLAEQGKSYQLTFEAPNGAITDLAADVVICCLPFSTLRTVELRCELSSQKQRAIRELGYGTNAKLILGTNTPIWRKQGWSGNVTSDLLTQAGWDATRMQGGAASAGAAFTVFLGGREGAQLGAGSTNEQAARHLPHLETMLRGTQAAFTGKAQRVVWANEPLARGSYACFKMGQYTSLASSIVAPVGGLYFAGEHCSREFQGYMNGAAQTGRMAAEQVLRRLGQQR